MSVRVDPGDLVEFRPLAASVLTRRDDRYFHLHRRWCLRLLIAGMIPIAGWLFLSWAAEELVLFLVVWLWTRNLGDVARIAVHDEKVQRAWSMVDEENYVDNMVSLLSGRTSTVPHREPGYPSRFFLIIGLVCSAVATFLLMTAASSSGFSLTSIQGTLFLTIAIVGMVVEEVASALRGSHGRLGIDVIPNELLPAAGPRGMGMFILTFAVLAMQGGNLSPGLLVLTFNGSMIFFGLMGLAGGLVVRQKNRWLQENLSNIRMPV